MHAHPVVRGGVPARGASLVFGVFLFALGIVLILESKLGLSPWDVLNQGLSRHTPLSFGMANVAVAIVVLFVAWTLGGPPGIGTVVNAVGVGSFIQALTAIGAATHLQHDPLGVRIVLLVAGVALIGPASAFYIGAHFGAGPRDTLMLVGSRRTGVRIAIVRGSLELCALVVGIVLGGTFGVGTLLFAFGVGPVIEASFWLLERTPIGRPVPMPANMGTSAEDGRLALP
ncbi:MAG: membrane protein [Actinomycetota bacterium]